MRAESAELQRKPSEDVTEKKVVGFQGNRGARVRLEAIANEASGRL